MLLLLVAYYSQRLRSIWLHLHKNEIQTVIIFFCCHSVAVLYFVSRTYATAALLNFLITVNCLKCYICNVYIFNSLLRLIVCVTQLNVITFVGLAAMNCRNEMITAVNMEKYSKNFQLNKININKTKYRKHSGSVCIWFQTINLKKLFWVHIHCVFFHAKLVWRIASTFCWLSMSQLNESLEKSISS